MSGHSQKRHRLGPRTDETAIESYMSACAGLIAYLRHHGDLTDLQFQVIMRTITTLELVLRQRNNPAEGVRTG